MSVNTETHVNGRRRVAGHNTLLSNRNQRRAIHHFKMVERPLISSFGGADGVTSATGFGEPDQVHLMSSFGGADGVISASGLGEPDQVQLMSSFGGPDGVTSASGLGEPDRS